VLARVAAPDFDIFWEGLIVRPASLRGVAASRPAKFDGRSVHATDDFYKGL